MNTRKVTMEYRMNQWIGIISQCRDSGQTVASWCREHDINSKSYYYWLRKIRTAVCNTLPTIKTEEHIVPLEINEISPSSPADSTHIPSETFQADIVLRVGAAVLEVHNSASASLIESMIKALQNVR
jgi:putative transposase